MKGENTKIDNILKSDEFLEEDAGIKFTPVDEFKIGKEKAENLLIEGENLHALTLLQEQYKDTVDIIYIDPPYNTGKKEFTYTDRFHTGVCVDRHREWLGFMEKRLQLAYELMKEKGVIYISIDDNEYAYLKVLCDGIFQESNFLGSIIQKKGNAQNDAINIQKNHEYILVYQKHEKPHTGKMQATLICKQSVEKEVFLDDNGYYYKNGGITTGGEGGTLNKRPNLGYTIYYHPISNESMAVMDYDKELARTSNDEGQIYTSNEKYISEGYVTIRPRPKGDNLGAWTWSIDKFNCEKENILIQENKDAYSVIKKQYVNQKDVFHRKGKSYVNIEKEVASKSIVEYSTAAGSKELSKVLGKKRMFTNPKNHEMIKYLIGLYPNKDALVLDFFAGSGTTAQSVMEINEEDSGNRNFILCTNNENNICQEVTYPRVRTIAEKVSNREREVSVEYLVIKESNSND